MKPRKVRLLERTWRIVAATLFFKSSVGTPLYCEINPHTGTLANLFSKGNTACQIGPPTFSKYTSIPAGQAAASSCSNLGDLWSITSSKPKTSFTNLHFSEPPAIPTDLAPASFASCPTNDPTAPLAAATTTVSPAFG